VMAAPDLNRAWALFMSDPTDFISMFAAVVVVVALFTVAAPFHRERKNSRP
jgi:ABC-type antimicrobial peptide transport system permease subunit